VHGICATHRLSLSRLPRSQRLAIMVGVGLLFAFLLSDSDGVIPPCQAKGKAKLFPVYRVLGLSSLENGGVL
jgi:hypothetical protein